MAKLLCFSVYDSKVQLYAQPFFMRSRGEALRGFTDVANDSSTSICRHPQDFALMELGEYDESTGKLENHPAPVSLGLAHEFKNQPVTQAPLFAEGAN